MSVQRGAFSRASYSTWRTWTWWERPPAAEALQMIATLAPDVVLLDWQMPELTGWQVVQQLPVATAPVLIFVTAFSEHADRADELSIDYLLKPVDVTSLTAALVRARRVVRRRAVEAASTAG